MAQHQLISTLPLDCAVVHRPVEAYNRHKCHEMKLAIPTFSAYMVSDAVLQYVSVATSCRFHVNRRIDFFMAGRKLLGSPRAARNDLGVHLPRTVCQFVAVNVPMCAWPSPIRRSRGAMAIVAPL